VPLSGARPAATKNLAQPDAHASLMCPACREIRARGESPPLTAPDAPPRRRNRWQKCRPVKHTVLVKPPASEWATAEIVKRDVVLTMIRPDLEDLPEFPLPPDFSVRWFQPGDEDTWVSLEHRADRAYTFTRELFWKQFSADPGLLCKRQCYLLDSAGQAVGTATAWLDEDFRGQNFGRVHWVAIVPEEQGRGLARPLLAIICRRLRELGHVRAFLRTSSRRIPALNLYRSFGFAPGIATSDDEAAWRALAPWLKPLGSPGLETRGVSG
jgi:GNAT superfamily N-acetyltransferase